MAELHSTTMTTIKYSSRGLEIADGQGLGETGGMRASVISIVPSEEIVASA